jgi:hypothetical protein
MFCGQCDDRLVATANICVANICEMSLVCIAPAIILHMHVWLLRYARHTTLYTYYLSTKGWFATLGQARGHLR